MSDLIISGVVDGPLTGGLPKAIELTVLNDIQDLSVYSIGVANNGGGTTDGGEFPLSGTANAGDKIYINSENSDAFLEFFGFAPTFVSGFAAVNGDDAVELFQDGEVVDVFGDPDVDGSGQAWEYTDGWAYRKNNSEPNPSFDDTEWTFSGPNALDGVTSNDDEATETPVPIGTFECFLTGTRLLTEQGEKRVEELRIGDRLQTLDGTLEQIKWIGIQTCYTHGHNHPLRTNPICVKAGALGPNCPIRDLYVSPDHALLVEGILVNAGALENGESIVQIQPTSETFVYYHIELERHNILIADGAPAESYLPQKQDRDTFDNGNEYGALYPHSNMQALVPMDYPRVSSKRQLPRFITKHIAKHHNLQTV